MKERRSPPARLSSIAQSLSLLSLLPLKSSQAISPSVPPVVAQERASQITLQPGATACDRACAALASQIPEQLFLGKAGNFRVWDAQQSDLTPACRVEPASSEDVSLILKTAIDFDCHFAIKSGGHARAAGASNADGGITIDLVRFNRVEISEDRKNVRVGWGLRWADVYKNLEEEGLMIVGGRVGDVGVGGLTLGGGISFFSARHGWACDSVISYEIVLPNDSTTSVTFDSHPSLYWALRGAGHSNFGIVTSFTVSAFPQPNPRGLWDVVKMYSWEKLPQLLPLHHTLWTSSLEQRLDLGGFNLFFYYPAYDSLIALDCYVHTSHESTSTWPEILRPFEELEGLPNSTNVEIAPMSSLTTGPGRSAADGDRTIFGTFSHRPSVELEAEIAAIYEQELPQIKSIDGVLPICIRQPIARSSMKQMSRNGGNALGLVESDGPLVLFSTTWTWKHASDDERMYETYYRFMDRVESVAKKLGAWHRSKYLNYAEATQDVWNGYGEENHRRLREVQRAVDPRGVFARGGLAGGPFKLNDRVVDEVKVGNGNGNGNGKSEL